MTITPILLKQLRADVDAALATLREKYALETLRLGKGSYDPDAGSFSFKLNGMAQGGKSPDAMRYELNQKLLSLPPLGFQFTSKGESFKTTGLNLTATKVLCERADKAIYLFKLDGIKRIAARAAKG